MAKVTSIIKLPSNFTYELSTQRIDNIPGTVTKSPNKLTIVRDNVMVDDGINVYVNLRGQKGFTPTMDVKIGSTKTNKKPIEPTYLQGGHYVFNYNY